MYTKTILKGTFVAFCLFGMLILPVAATSAGQATNNHAIDQALKDDLWNNHQQYRLQRFDMNVQRANSVITILNKYGIDTTTCHSTLTTISSKRPALENALSDKNKEELKSVNAELKTLWDQFRQEIRDAIKAHYGTQASTAT